MQNHERGHAYRMKTDANYRERQKHRSTTVAGILGATHEG